MALMGGLHTSYNGRYRGLPTARGANPQNRLVVRIEAATDSMKVGIIVIADQHAAVNTFPGLVHTARHVHGSWKHQK